MASNPPFAFDAVSDSADNATALGGVWFKANTGKAFRLVKAGANLTKATPQTFVTALVSDAPSWIVSTTTTAANHLRAGTVQTDVRTTSATADQIDSGQYFFVQVQGVGEAYSAGAFSAGDDIFTSGTAGEVDDIGSVASLTDNSGGTASDTLADITEVTTTGAADRVPTENAVASLAAKVNALLAAGSVDTNAVVGTALKAATGNDETVDVYFKML